MVTTSVSRRRSLFIWGLCCALAGATFVVYAAASRGAGQGQLLMPLDDAYIHFQYARQIAAFQPYVYNPGLPSTSGATSFLYPYVLAAGAWLRLDGLNLGLWGIAVGAAALALSAWLVDQLALALGVRRWLAALFACLFALNGLLAWHFMSGMETGLTVLFTLLTLYGVAARQTRWTIAGAALLALTRPEGAVLAVLVVIVSIIQAFRVDNAVGMRRSVQLNAPTILRSLRIAVFPILAIGVQPLVNWLVTGSAVASGNAAKSLFGIIPADMGVIIGRIINNFVSMWGEFFTPGAFVSPALGLFALGLLALVGLTILEIQKRTPFVVLVVVWLVAGTLAVSTLDTAFWHFRRYQMPFIAAMFPLAAVGVNTLLNLVPAARAVVGVGVVALAFASTLGGTLDYLNRYAVNVGYVYAQPYQMARWLAATTLPDAVIAVHDVGMMRYVGGRTTLDMVGLTTPGAADYWRNGPGSTGEFLERMRPAYIASYGHGHGLGLGYLADTDLYANPQAEYTVALDPAINVALAADTQGIYIPDWTTADHAPDLHTLPFITPYLTGMTLVDAVDVADIGSERAHEYQWGIGRPLGGFPTEYNQFATLGCTGDACVVSDGGRRINHYFSNLGGAGGESFVVNAPYEAPVILVTRLHPATTGQLTISVDGRTVGTTVIPALPGAWLEVPILLGNGTGQPMQINILPSGDGDYMPYYHWVYQGQYSSGVESVNPNDVLARFGRSIDLLGVETDYRAADDQVVFGYTWLLQGDSDVDAKVFIHVLDENGNVAVQLDARPGSGALPPGNWLPGVFRDTMVLGIAGVPQGRFQILMGLYDPVTFDRLVVTNGDEQNRLLIGEVVIGSDG